MAHPYVPSQEGLLCLPAQSQERGGDTGRRAITRGELDRAVEGKQPSGRTGICSFVRGGTGGALPEPYKMTSSGLLVCMFLTKLVYTDSVYCCDPPKPTVPQGVTEVCAFGDTKRSLFGFEGVLTYDIVDDQNEGAVKRLALMFSVPYNYLFNDNWFALGFFDLDEECDESLFNRMYRKRGTFRREKASGSEIYFQCGKFTLRGTMSPAAKADMKVEFLD
ncbi:hypothetical protein SKAU_G00077200 [Synaphobranchus kaupii]|uniref:Uncharacterized protein n=1 Tax=Synaphobranchus kaupii TaxID=118154 RepID=A0A9Q1G836_SYNKA|nr:hypothetical protein SKAU_G00077200 [Synaphobranchus kaupii]